MINLKISFLRIVFIALCSLSTAFGVEVGDVIKGKVVAVSDGDTISVYTETSVYKIRLDKIDAPERGQAYGNKAKQALAKKVAGKVVSVEVQGLDQYGRVIGLVTVFGENINYWMVRNGWAWQYLKHDKSELYKLAEAKARGVKIGLWADTSSGVRHNQGCRYYSNTKRGRSCNGTAGRACGKCGG